MDKGFLTGIAMSKTEGPFIPTTDSAISPALAAAFLRDNAREEQAGQLTVHVLETQPVQDAVLTQQL